MHEAGHKVVREQPRAVVVYLYGAKGDLSPGWYIRAQGTIVSGPYVSSDAAEDAFKETE